MKPFVITSVIFVVCSLQSCTRSAEPWRPDKSTETITRGYCVVSLVEDADPFYAAVEELKRLHNATVLKALPESLEALLPALQTTKPQYVAIVVRPESLDINLVGRFMKLATRVDEDPFIDFAYGFITGDDPQTALSLIEAGQLTDATSSPSIAMIGVMGDGMHAQSSSTLQQLPLRSGFISQTAHMIAGKEAGNRDSAFIESVMPKLDRKPILVFAGHGYPREVVGGPTFEHLKNRDFRGSIALNIACYTGVTGRWFEEDWGIGKVVQRQVPSDESFCLNILKTGVAGYVAYACPRPAGPSMLGDSMMIAISGQSLGELRRQDGNSTVLSHLQQGFDGLQFNEWTADAPINATRKTQDFLISISTGGLLFGDPGCTPFSAKQDTDPRSLETSVHGDVLSATVRISGPLWHFFCADQITMWDDKTPSYRIETVIPIGNRYPKSVRLKNSSFGDVPHQLIAAVEEHDHKRLLHLKASFKQPAIQELIKLSQRGVSGSFEVTLSDEVKSDTIRVGERR